MTRFITCRIRQWRLLLFLAVCSLSVLTLNGTVEAGQRDWDRFRISLGTYLVSMDTTVRIDSSNGSGTTIGLEDDLGMDSEQTELIFSTRYRFARRHILALSYLEMKRDALTTLSRDLQIGDEMFTIGEDVETKFDFELLDISYAYALVQKPRFDFVISFGISTIDYDVGVRTAAAFGTAEERSDETFPVPSVGLGFVHRFTPRWALRTGFKYFKYSENEWETRLSVYDLDVEYHPWRRVGFALGYNLFVIEYDELGDDALFIDYEYDGILIRALFSF